MRHALSGSAPESFGESCDIGQLERTGCGRGWRTEVPVRYDRGLRAAMVGDQRSGQAS